jgi:hypothetical protein
LCSLATHSCVSQNTERKFQILTFLFVHAFFEVKKPVTGIAEVYDTKTKEPASISSLLFKKSLAMSASIRLCLQDAFSKVLVRLASVKG